MNLAETKAASKKLNKELFDLSPSSLVSLFEIDCTEILLEAGLVKAITAINLNQAIFRFHNNLKMGQTAIFWQGNRYVLAPIAANGFEISGSGTLPTPKLSITVNEAGVQELTTLKQRLFEMGDLVGAKVTRIRTFAKFLDAATFGNDVPQGFEPDPNVEMPRDVFYVDRKTFENKNAIEYQLASILDVEGVKLPGRIVLSNRCPARYRGELCWYEADSRRDERIHGDTRLPTAAPWCASFNDESFVKILGPNVLFVDRGEYDSTISYAKGNTVFFSRGGLKYYFLCKEDNPPQGPPSLRYWIPDVCSKTPKACNLRWGLRGTVDVSNTSWKKGVLPFVGFPGTNKFS